ncbi:MAG: DUF523 and DUF1722 domain-containing protein [Candidatus Pelagadaptatus aseana]|uniref:YbgA family protein n=1 Tax=Candidatus Pelagadaptatus aseana TaxID=3120508 RepID=UPI0039B239AB
MSSTKPVLGISACLLGENVRYNGGHKLSRFCRNALGEYVEYRPVCPEMAAGLGVPRPSIRLISTDKDSDQVRAVETRNPEVDHTLALEQASDRLVEGLGDLDGFILMQKSPSCGMAKVKVYQPNGYADNDGVGVFAGRLQEKYPFMPVEEAGRLQDDVIREHFLTKVYLYQQVRQLEAKNLTAGELLEFHAGNKYLLMAYNAESYRQLGRMLANLKRGSLEEIKQNYLQKLMTALNKPISRGRHVNVLQHLVGYLKQLVTTQDKEELLFHIRQYHQGIVPLVVPMTLLLHHFKRFPQECAYVLKQRYLQPHPDTLGLRSKI